MTSARTRAIEARNSALKEELVKIREAIKAKDKATTEELGRLKHDIKAYRGALGYAIPGDHDGRLSDGTEPKCGLCEGRLKCAPEVVLQELVEVHGLARLVGFLDVDELSGIVFDIQAEEFRSHWDPDEV